MVMPMTTHRDRAEHDAFFVGAFERSGRAMSIVECLLLQRVCPDLHVGVKR
jgi:hypothetical protein